MSESDFQSSVHSGPISYALHSLGWKAFQSLCVTITAEVWGQTVTSFADTNDGGRDGAFHGEWTASSGESFHGNFTIQAKFTAKESKSLALSDLDDEYEKAKRLAAKGLATTYILMTNAVLSGATEEELRAKFEAIYGLEKFAAYGPNRISQMIHENSKLRMLVPRIYGLGDLGQILDERAYAQSQDILSALGDDLSKFVITYPFRLAARALIEHGFVLLLGEPACGKSTIAAALALGALDQWGCSTVKVVSPAEFIKHSNPNEPKQFFWVDDAFGATQLDWSATVGWNKMFPHIHAAIKRGARVVFTSRDYIYRGARNHLKSTAFPLMNESQVVIDVQNLTKGEREQILYNHVRLGQQEQEFKTQVKPFLPSAAAHERFSPEGARRLGTPLFTKSLSLTQYGIDDFFERPMDLLSEIIRTLDANSKSAIALVYIRGGTLPSPVEIAGPERKAIDLVGGSKSDVRMALTALDDSLLSLVKKDEGHYWGFRHPTIRDAFAILVAEDPELLDIYLAGTPVSTLLGEVCCGDVGIEGAKVIVPASRFDLFSERLEVFLRARRGHEDRVYRFLSYRCSKEYLEYFVHRHPEFVSSLRVFSYLYAIADVDLLVRLNEFGLLEETRRKSVIKEIGELAIEVPDSGFLASDIRTLFAQDELQFLLVKVREELFGSLDRKIDDWRWNYSSEEDPEQYFDPLISALKEYSEEFSEEGDIVGTIEEGLSSIQSVIDDLRADLPVEPDYGEYSGAGATSSEGDSGRSIFDDVDQ